VGRSLKGGLLMGSERQNNQLELAFGEAVRGEAPPAGVLHLLDGKTTMQPTSSKVAYRRLGRCGWPGRAKEIVVV